MSIIGKFADAFIQEIKAHRGAALTVMMLIIFNGAQFHYIHKQDQKFTEYARDKDKELRDCNKEVKDAVLMLVDELRLMREHDHKKTPDK